MIYVWRFLSSFGLLYHIDMKNYLRIIMYIIIIIIIIKYIYIAQDREKLQMR